MIKCKPLYSVTIYFHSIVSYIHSGLQRNGSENAYGRELFYEVHSSQVSVRIALCAHLTLVTTILHIQKHVINGKPSNNTNMSGNTSFLLSHLPSNGEAKKPCF